jgi:hypothetical protein
MFRRMMKFITADFFVTKKQSVFLYSLLQTMP